jgi:hypothetical protein
MALLPLTAPDDAPAPRLICQGGSVAPIAAAQIPRTLEALRPIILD